MIERVGFTKFPNDLTEALCASKLGSLELRAVLYLWRTTNGYRFKGVPQRERAVSLAEWTRVLGSRKSHISVALKALEAKRVIRRESQGIGKGYKYSLNMAEEWSPVTKSVTVTKEVTVAENQNGTVYQNRNGTVTPLASATPPIKRNIKRKYKKKGYDIPFVNGKGGNPPLPNPPSKNETLVDKIATYLQGKDSESSPKEISDNLDIPIHKVRIALSKAKKRRLVENVGRGRWKGARQCFNGKVAE
jgi:hypothetical protein